MTTLITKKNIGYRIQQVFIFVLHIILLSWMYYTLANSGKMQMTEVFYHFIGLSIYGAILIRGCAYWGRYHYLKELKEIEASKESTPQ